MLPGNYNLKNYTKEQIRDVVNTLLPLMINHAFYWPTKFHITPNLSNTTPAQGL